jgi:hypothetical protein
MVEVEGTPKSQKGFSVLEAFSFLLDYGLAFW